MTKKIALIEADRERIFAEGKGDFIGRDATPRVRIKGITTTLVCIDPDIPNPRDQFDIDLLGTRHRATVLAESVCNPKNERLRAWLSG